MYKEEDLVRLAKRRNNKKRTYLVVNRLQGKHIPVSGNEAFRMFDQLAESLKTDYEGEKLLLIGFAETATAIGARVAIKLHALYMQTTREKIKDVDYLYFSESHSHATEQKLVKDDLDSYMNTIDRVIFIEDEVTTGNTILGIVNILRETYGKKVKFSVASILNGMDQEARKKYAEQGIALHYLVKTDHSKYPEMVSGYHTEGTYINGRSFDSLLEYKELEINGYVNARRLVSSDEYENACENLWKELKKNISDSSGNQLVIGTEEFMYPALFVAAKMEELGINAVSHSTTRSPIAVFDEEDYPIHVANEIGSLYEEERITYIYDLKKYDKVYVITDAVKTGLEKDLINVLKKSGNEDITIVRWKE